MGLLEQLLLGCALAMDAFAVTISDAAAYAHERRRLWLLPVAFGLAQGLMPVLGYYAGSVAADLIEAYAGVLTLVVLGIIGGDMVWEGIRNLRGTASDDEKVEEGARLTVPTVFFQSIATAIDAFAVGVSLRAQGVDIFGAAVIICLATAAICAVALLLGRKAGDFLGHRAGIVGGVVLIAIGLKAFLS